MMKQISKASSNPRARITGLIYLFYFLTAGAGVFLTSRNLVVYGYIINIISIACYIAVTILLYYLFKPVNRYLSLLAAFFSLTGCAFMSLSFSFISPYQTLSTLLHFFWTLLHSTWLPHYQVDIPALFFGSSVGICRYRLANISLTARKLFLPVY